MSHYGYDDYRYYKIRKQPFFAIIDYYYSRDLTTGKAITNQYILTHA